MQPCNYIIGATAFLDHSYNSWQEYFPNEKIEKIYLQQDEYLKFDLTPLKNIDLSNSVFFAAYDEGFGNFIRADLIKSLLDLGAKLTNFISPRAIVPSNIKLGTNVFIGDGVIIGQDCRIDFNSYIFPGAIIGDKTHIRSSCWIESGVQIGHNVAIGSHTTIRLGAQVSNGLKIGLGCELGWPVKYGTDLSPNTTFDPRYSEQIKNFNNTIK